jgi:hypothetical protein
MPFKKINFILFLVFFSLLSRAQQRFPADWAGNWKGELSWYQGVAKEPRKVMMELRIQPTDSAHKWTWQIIYGSSSEDNRPYTLVAKDTTNAHWIIDEHNGIKLDQFFIANQFSGAFTVKTSTIINNYRLENDQLVAEFYSMTATPLSTTGNGTDDSPSVNSYKMNSYQKAILQRIK